MGVLDPDCVRVPMARRVAVAPLPWAKLPGLTAYQRKLQVGGEACGGRRAGRQAGGAAPF